MWKFDESVFQKNLGEFGKGSLMESLARPDRDRERWEVMSSREGSPTLLWDNASLHSRYDPVSEGVRWAEAAVLASSDDLRGYLVMGLGLGYHVMALLEKTTQPVAVFEPHPDILRASFRLMPWHRHAGRLTFLTDPSDSKRLPDGYQVLTHVPSEKVRPDSYRSLRRTYEGGESPSSYSLRVLVVSPVSGGSYPIARSVQRSLLRMGHRASLFDGAVFEEALRAIGVQTRIDLHRAQLRGLFQGFLSEMILARVMSEKPDLVIGLAQSPLSPELLEKLAGMGIPVAYWFVEDFRLATYWERIAPLVTSFAVIQKDEWIPRLEARGLSNVTYLPTGADSDIFTPQMSGDTESDRFSSPVSFLGAGYYNRRHFLKHFVDLGLSIWGADWDPSDPLFRYVREEGRRLSPEDAAKVYRQSEINLNLHSSVYHRGVNPDGDFVNPRTFEIAACAGFQLVDRRTLLPELFITGEEIVLFEDERSCRKLVSHYRTHEGERRTIALAGNKRVLRDHTIDCRMERWLSVLFDQGFAPKRPLFPGRQKVDDLVTEASGDPALSDFFDRYRCFGTVDLEDLERGIRPQESPISDTEASVLLLREFVREVGA